MGKLRQWIHKVWDIVKGDALWHLITEVKRFLWGSWGVRPVLATLTGLIVSTWSAIQAWIYAQPAHVIVAYFLFTFVCVLAVIHRLLMLWDRRQHLSQLPAPTPTTQPSNPTIEPQSNKTTAQLRLEELQRQKTQPYTIREADQKKFVETLRLAGKFSVNIAHSFDDPIASIFAEELTTLLTLSQWKIGGWAPDAVLVTGGKYSPGVTITVNEKEETPLGATILMRLLREQGIWITQHTAPPRKVSPASFDIFIGEKE
jgi:hypothetical protein